MKQLKRASKTMGSGSARWLTAAARLARWAGCGVAALAMQGAATAQSSSRPPNAADASPTVSWTIAPIVAPKHAGRVVIRLHGSIRDGWHIYGLKQLATGPTPLVVAVERNDIALGDGAPAGSRPVVAYEPAFGFVTPYYARSVEINVPVRFRSRPVPGRHLVPVSLRYQSCDGRICEPPKTLHLIAPIDVRADS